MEHYSSFMEDEFDIDPIFNFLEKRKISNVWKPLPDKLDCRCQGIADRCETTDSRFRQITTADILTDISQKITDARKLRHKFDFPSLSRFDRRTGTDASISFPDELDCSLEEIGIQFFPNVSEIRNEPYDDEDRDSPNWDDGDSIDNPRTSSPMMPPPEFVPPSADKKRQIWRERYISRSPILLRTYKERQIPKQSYKEGHRKIMRRNINKDTPHLSRTPTPTALMISWSSLDEVLKDNKILDSPIKNPTILPNETAQFPENNKKRNLIQKMDSKTDVKKERESPDNSTSRLSFPSGGTSQLLRKVKNIIENDDSPYMESILDEARRAVSTNRWNSRVSYTSCPATSRKFVVRRTTKIQLRRQRFKSERKIQALRMHMNKFVLDPNAKTFNPYDVAWTGAENERQRRNKCATTCDNRYSDSERNILSYTSSDEDCEDKRKVMENLKIEVVATRRNGSPPGHDQNCDNLCASDSPWSVGIEGFGFAEEGGRTELPVTQGRNDTNLITIVPPDDSTKPTVTQCQNDEGVRLDDKACEAHLMPDMRDEIAFKGLAEGNLQEGKNIDQIRGKDKGQVQEINMGQTQGIIPCQGPNENYTFRGCNMIQQRMPVQPFHPQFVPRGQFMVPNLYRPALPPGFYCGPQMHFNPMNNQRHNFQHIEGMKNNNLQEAVSCFPNQQTGPNRFQTTGENFENKKYMGNQKNNHSGTGLNNDNMIPTKAYKSHHNNNQKQICNDEDVIRPAGDSVHATQGRLREMPLPLMQNFGVPTQGQRCLVPNSTVIRNFNNQPNMSFRNFGVQPAMYVATRGPQIIHPHFARPVFVQNGNRRHPFEMMRGPNLPGLRPVMQDMQLNYNQNNQPRNEQVQPAFNCGPAPVRMFWPN